MCESLHEGAVKVEKAHHFSYFGDICQCGPCVDPHNFYWVHACHPLFKDYPQVIHGWRMEKAFFRFEVEVMFFRHAKNILNGSDMSHHIGSCSDANIIHIDAD